MRRIQRYGRVIVAVQLVLLFGVRSAGAQSTSDEKLSELIPNLLIQNAVDNITAVPDVFAIRRRRQ